MNETERPWVAYGIDSKHPCNANGFHTDEIHPPYQGLVAAGGKCRLLGQSATYGFRILTIQAAMPAMWGIHAIEVVDDIDNEIFERSLLQGGVPLTTLEDRLSIKVRRGQRVALVVENYDSGGSYRFCGTLLGRAFDFGGEVNMSGGIGCPTCGK